MQVEEVLRSHPEVLEVAVGGSPDPVWGTRLVAYVVVSPAGHDLDPARLLAELRELVGAQIAPFAGPRELVVVPGLPRTAIGKVSRSGLAGLEGRRALVG